MARYMQSCWPGRSWPAGPPGGRVSRGRRAHGHGDPCWPDRYANEAAGRRGGQLPAPGRERPRPRPDVWNTHFETGTDKLNGGRHGQAGPARPPPAAPGPAAVPADGPGHRATTRPSRTDYAAKRSELDTKRVAAVQKYLATSLTGRPTTFDIQVHDPAMPGVDGAAPRRDRPDPAPRVRGGTGRSAGRATLAGRHGRRAGRRARPPAVGSRRRAAPRA